MRAALLALALLAAAPLRAQPLELTLPEGANVSAEKESPATSYQVLTGPWKSGGGAGVELEGNRHDTAWRLRGNQQTTLQIRITSYNVCYTKLLRGWLDTHPPSSSLSDGRSRIRTIVRR